MTLFERAIRVLLRLHPPSFRRRFGAEVERTAREAVARRPRGSTALFLAGDVAWTLVPAWGREGVTALAAIGRSCRRAAASVLQDVRFALRGLRRQPLQGLVMVATLTLAEMKILAFLTDPPVVRGILLHLDLPNRPPPVAPARGPPQAELTFDQTPDFDPADPEPPLDFDFDQSPPDTWDD